MRSFLPFTLILSLAAVAQSAVITAVDADGDTVLASVRGTTTQVFSTIGLAGNAVAGDNAPQPAQVVGAPASICSTEGCPVIPTTYTQSGVIVTFVATTPTTPIPTWSSSGAVLGISQYISTTITASQLLSSSQNLEPWSAIFGGKVGAIAIAVVGALVGAAVVL